MTDKHNSYSKIINEEGFESYEPALFENWIIKTSTLDSQIQIFAINIVTNDTVIRWFDSKEEAGLWLECLVSW